MTGPRCDAVVDRWTLGSRRVTRSALNLVDPHWLLAHPTAQACAAGAPGRAVRRSGSVISIGIRHPQHK
jgi:hypothetical protein